jgi:flagellar biosynthesis/type III secretory pathway protein FliH
MKNGDSSIDIYSYPESTKELLNPWADLAMLPIDSKMPSDPESPELLPSADRDPAFDPAKPQADISPYLEEVRRQGFEEGRSAEREEISRRRKKEETLWREQVSALISQFASERDRYLEKVEHEVVELALAIASRILRREAQMDPLLLMSAVRVALGQLAETTTVNLLVPQADLELWKETIAHIPNLPLKPVLRGGDNLHPGNCILATELGSVNLGVQAQLAEIERGFFDARERGTKVSQTATSSPEKLR